MGIFSICITLMLMCCRIVFSHTDLRDCNSHNFKCQTSPWPSPTEPFPYRLKFRLPAGGRCPNFSICYRSQLALPSESGIKWAKRFIPPPEANKEIDDICANTKSALASDLLTPSLMNAILHGIKITVDSKAIWLLSPFGDRHEILVHPYGNTTFTLELWHNDETVVTKLLVENDDSEEEAKIVRGYRHESPQGAHLQDYTGLWLLGLDMLPRDSDTVSLLINQTADCDLIPIFFEPGDFDDSEMLEEDEKLNNCTNRRVTTTTTSKTTITSSATSPSNGTVITTSSSINTTNNTTTTVPDDANKTNYCHLTFARAKPLCDTFLQNNDENGDEPTEEYFCAVQLGWMLDGNEWTGIDEKALAIRAAEIKKHLADIVDPKRRQFSDWVDMYYSRAKRKWKRKISDTGYDVFSEDMQNYVQPYLVNKSWGMPALLHFYHPFFVPLNPNWVMKEDDYDYGYMTPHYLVDLLVHKCTLPGSTNANNETVVIEFASAMLISEISINNIANGIKVDYGWDELSDSLKKCQQKYEVLNNTEEYIVRPNAEYNISNIDESTFRRKSTLRVGFTMEDNTSPDHETLQFFEYLFGGLAHLGLQHNDQYSQGPVDPHWKLADYEAEVVKFGGHFLVPAALAIMPAKNYPVEVNFTASKWTNDEATNWKGEKFGDLYKEKFLGMSIYNIQAQKRITQLVASCYMFKAGQGQFNYEIRTGRLRLIEVVEKYPNVQIYGYMYNKTVDFIYAQYPAGKDPSIAGIRIDDKQLQQKPKQLNGSSIDNRYPLEMDAYAYGYEDEVDHDD